MNLSRKRIGGIAVIIFLLAFIYFFTGIVVYLLIAAIISFIGAPIMQLLGNIKYKKFSLPNGLKAVISLLLIISVFALLISLLFPAIATQATNFSEINTNAIANSLQEPIANLDNKLKSYGILEADESLSLVISEKLKNLITTIDFDSIIGNVIGLTGNFFIGTFAILFFSFFFIKDSSLFNRIIMAFVPVKQKHQTSEIMIKTKKLLTRYSIGLMIEVLSMMTLISIGAFIFGIENAILIGFLGGLMNIIPYLGPIIGATIGSSLVVLSNLDVSFVDVTFFMILKLLSVFLVANLFDNMVLQPFIYSNSVKAHPMEIFIVIIVAGSLGGPIGMIFAIPVYTIFRIVAKEFLSELEVIRNLTKDI